MSGREGERAKPRFHTLTQCLSLPLSLSPTRPLLLVLTLCLTTAAHATVWTEVEKSIGKLTLEEMKLRHGFVQEPLLQNWLDRTADPIAQLPGRKLSYRFYILDSHENNAFSLPGGYVCVMRGLLNRVTSDEELAGVLAHEIAHAENRDFQRLMQQQLLYLGAQGLMRGKVEGEWIYVTRIIQVLDGLRRQRKHELQADLTGAELSYHARYDPQGLISFLQGIGPGRGGTEIFATHPKAEKRLQAVRGRIAELQAQDYQGLLAIGDSLRHRLHYQRAASVYEQAARLQPDRPEAAARLAEVRQRQGLEGPNGAVPHPARIADQGPDGIRPHSAPPEAETEVSLPDEQKAQVATTLQKLRVQEKELYESEKRLRRSLLHFAKDREIARALAVAQVVAPETDDLRYLATLARAYYTLEAARDEAVRQGEIVSRAGAVRAGWERSAEDLQKSHKVKGATAANEAELSLAAEQFRQSVPAVVATNEAVSRSAKVADDLADATRLLAIAFLALVGSGPDQPLGRLNYTRFLLLQGEVTMAEQRIRRVIKAGRQAHAEIVRKHLEVLAEQITILHATARPEMRELDLKLIAQRLGREDGRTGGREDMSRLSSASLGSTILTRYAPPDTSPADLQAIDSVLRMSYLDMRGERMPLP